MMEDNRMVLGIHPWIGTLIPYVYLKTGHTLIAFKILEYLKFDIPEILDSGFLLSTFDLSIIIMLVRRKILEKKAVQVIMPSVKGPVNMSICWWISIKGYARS